MGFVPKFKVNPFKTQYIIILFNNITGSQEGDI